MILSEDFYLLRTPLLSINTLQQFSGLPHAQLAEKLKFFFADPCLQEAIYIASPELYLEFQKWQQGKLQNEKENNKLVLALFKYLLRMCARCTPYGLFAGCAMGEVQETSHVKIGSFKKHKKHCRLDMNYVAELAAMIMEIPEVQKQLLYYPNNSLYQIGNRYRYAEFAVKNKFRNYYLTEIAFSGYLKKIIALAEEGASLSALAESIVNIDISKEEAAEFVNELIQNQILVSGLEPTVTGDEFFKRLVVILKSLEHTKDITEKLTQIQCLLQDQQTGTDKYLRAHAIVKSLLPATNNKDLVQTDFFLSTEANSISACVVAEIQQHVEKLWALAKPNYNPDLENFIKTFLERYEDQEVPFTLALDAESGIGYAGYSSGNAGNGVLVNDIFIKKETEIRNIAWTKMESFQLKKLYSCLQNNEHEIVLTDKDIDELKDPGTVSIPDSFYLMGSLLGGNAAAIDEGEFQFVLNACGGPSGASLLGRFCHGDEKLLEKVRQHLADEERQNPNMIYAEVVHLPEARTGNVLMRPQLREYEIVYLGNGSVAAENQIPATDLVIRIENNAVVLRSKKLNKRIIPRLSTAHNFSVGNLPVYKFLCDLQFQQLSPAVGWRWNLPGDESFLPRVSYGKIILSKCTWTLHKKNYPQLTEAKTNAGINYVKLVAEMQAALHLPAFIVIVEGDNELLIDLSNESCIKILIDTLIKKEKIVLQEFLATEDQCFVDGENGKHTSEIIIPFKRLHIPQPNTVIAADNFKTEIRNTPQRTFITGSEWLYLKIYCGTNSAERILKEVINPLTEELKAEDKIEQWFFIRYADPENHIRIRFQHTKDPSFWKAVMERFYALLNERFKDATIYKVQTDTYNREIERYGADTIELSEYVFSYDSEAVIHCIDLLSDEDGEKFRWLLCMRGIDMLLDDFNYQLEEKAALLKMLQQDFLTEFGGNKELNNLLNDKYRENMQQIRSFLDKNEDVENEIEDAVYVFRTRSIKVKPVIKQIKKLLPDSHAVQRLDSLVCSYMHMFINRMFLCDQRKYELVIYHFLRKHYESQVVRSKKKITESELVYLQKEEALCC